MIKQIADQARAGHCAVRARYAQNVEDARKFLEGGGSIPGITRAQLQRSLDLNQELVDSIDREVHC